MNTISVELPPIIERFQEVLEKLNIPIDEKRELRYKLNVFISKHKWINCKFVSEIFPHPTLRGINWNIVLNMFENGHSMVEIANRFNCTRAHISYNLRKYYEEHPRYRSILLHKTCIVCGTEEISETKKVSVLSESDTLRLKDTTIEKKFVCSLCETQNLYKCATCGAVLHKSEAANWYRNEVIRTVRCKKCSNALTEKWISTHRERWREIIKNSSKKNRQKYNLAKKNMEAGRARRGLCIKCGKNNDNHEEYKLCEVCRRASCERAVQKRKNRIDNKLCIRCGKPLDGTHLNCETCLDYYKKVKWYKHKKNVDQDMARLTQKYATSAT